MNLNDDNYHQRTAATSMSMMKSRPSYQKKSEVGKNNIFDDFKLKMVKDSVGSLR